VSRECGLIDQSAEVYVPRFLKGSSTDPDSELRWESVVHEGDELSSDTLQVNCAFRKDYIYYYFSMFSPFHLFFCFF
jgi:hypothetical protein